MAWQGNNAGKWVGSWQGTSYLTMLYVYSAGTWSLVREAYVYSGGAWQIAKDVWAYNAGIWNKILG